MEIRTYSYSEFEPLPHMWKVDTFNLDTVNLFVGRNASGKTRVLTGMSFLIQFLNGQSFKNWNSGIWNISLTDGEDLYELEVTISVGIAIRERLLVNGSEKLSRGEDGSGSIWYDELESLLSFKIETDTLAMVTKRDAVQHSFLEKLHEWASRVRLFLFGTEFGRQQVHVVRTTENPGESEEALSRISDPNAVVAQYHASFKRFGHSFDQAMLDDLRSIGYFCTMIASGPAPGVVANDDAIPTVLYLKEEDRDVDTSQFYMSTGMFRAVALLIHINNIAFSGGRSTVFIDDIGEGLDFERSTALIKLIIDRCKEKSIQVIMTTNDRFVMNQVDLIYWHIVERSGAIVNIIDYENSKRQFDEFKYLGLSNFNFFSERIYAESVH